MQYSIVHRTSYQYEYPVTVGHYTACLEPRHLTVQRCPWHRLKITPEPNVKTTHLDAFGNLKTYFEIEGSHQEMEVISRSLVHVSPSRNYPWESTPPWESIRDAAHFPTTGPAMAAAAFAYASPLVSPAPIFREYAAPSFTAHRPVLAVVCELNERIFQDFKFDPTATDSATPVTEAFAQRRGVCQDLAHIMIACLRSMGIPARYVSGYLETIPPPGRTRLVGADASHAWVSVFCGESVGWIDADPTNNLLPSERHVTLAWGRDFKDIIPLRGISIGAGKQHLTVSVDVEPIATD
jgi:transglutaminase-like putative cysteine protease